ncbi:MAG: 4-hydroxythreonine-4-phosphate dehydrogenase PdxA [Elusimicrobiota bacterium]|jgi:4-hydroxythreonine-4-phosphate dehydrogenase
MKPRIVIALGDPAGIGPEIVSKALQDERVHACCTPLVVGDPLALTLHRQPLPRAPMLAVPGLNKRLRLGHPSAEAGRSAIDSLTQATTLLMAGQAEALVTAPVSKESFDSAGLGFPGHTEWLAVQVGSKPVAMLMVAGPLRTILMTRHIPLQDVSCCLTAARVRESARLGFDFIRRILKKKHPRLVACGVNPHAGDGGLIGKDEMKTLRPALRALAREGILVTGPLSADSVFRDMAKGTYDLVLAAYHDQGMIPLKLYAPDRLVNITLGLPFIRTSPGHGTAFDIAGKNRADARPMIEAIILAARYSQ